jgi:hypothetical protein
MDVTCRVIRCRQPIDDCLTGGIQHVGEDATAPSAANNSAAAYADTGRRAGD